MTTITKDVPTGTVTNAEQLQRELSASADVGARCEGVAIYEGELDDTLELTFDVAPDDTAVDAVIASHPSYAFGFPESLVVTADTWTTLYETAIAPGEWAEINTKVIVTTGDVATLEAHTVHFDCMARRRTGESVVVSDRGSGRNYGDLPDFRVRGIAASESIIRVQLNIARSDTLTVQFSAINSERGFI
jgi:hypothetical protein